MKPKNQIRNNSQPEQAQAIVLQLLDTAAAVIRRLDRALSVRGISYSEYRLLQTLINEGEVGVTRIELAHAVGLTASAVTRALKPLEKLGLTTSTRNERDARQSLAVITPAGVQLLDDVNQVLGDFFAGLPVAAMSDDSAGLLQTQLSLLREAVRPGR
ncbi:MAG: MarR family transcriptional regulator [Proteobacteria bacterium]|nr:MarR family transcriptional regulator [Pseudomonadota bacterium]